MKKECKLGFVKCKINYDDVNVSVRIMWGIAFKNNKNSKTLKLSKFFFFEYVYKTFDTKYFFMGI